MHVYSTEDGTRVALGRAGFKFHQSQGKTALTPAEIFFHSFIHVVINVCFEIHVFSLCIIVEGKQNS